MQANMPPRTVVSERRKEARKRPRSLVYVELSAANGGMLRDLSELGFAMRAMMPLQVGEVTAFSFSLDEVTRLEGRCKVLWVEEDGRLAGMLFTEILPNVKEHVRAWLGLKQKYTAPPEPTAPAEDTSFAKTMEELREELRTVAPRPIAPDRDELPLPELREESPAPMEMNPQQEDPAETAREILREVEVATANPESQTQRGGVEEAIGATRVEPAQLLQPLPEMEETEIVGEQDKPRAWQTRLLLWLAVRMLIVFALVAFVVFYHRPVGHAIIWVGQKVAGEDAAEISPVPKSEIKAPEPEAAQNATASSSSSSATSRPTSETASEPVAGGTSENGTKEAASVAEPKTTAEVPQVIENRMPAPTGNLLLPAPVTLPATDKMTTFTNAEGTSPDGGQQEYLAAEEMLRNKNGMGLKEVVRLLWVAVEKGNSGAEVALGELYRTGHGVAKNCDQAKILFTAAVRKGNAEGRKHLDQFLAEGCE